MHSAHMCTESASDRGNRKQDAVCADEDEVAAGVDAQRKSPGGLLTTST